MELKDMFPPVSEFELEIAGETKIIKLRKVSLRDHIFCHHIFEGEILATLEKRSNDINSICRLVYQQIVFEDTKFFKTKNAEMTHEDGTTEKITIGGHELLARYVDSIDAFQQMLDAYQCAVIAGLPTISKKKA